MTSKENKKYKRKDSLPSEQIKSREPTVVKRDSDTDIVEGGYWH
jgi:hypothetical protein